MPYGARFGAAVVVAGALAGCRTERPATDDNASTGAAAAAESSAPASVTVTARDYAFDAPARIPAGVTTFRLVNKGKELHHAQIVKIDEGKTMADVGKAMQSGGPPPSWVKFVGGPNAVAPGGEAQATSNLAPGNYVYLCFIPGPDRVAHAEKGMVKPFTVSGEGSASKAELPASNITITMVDYDYQLSQPLSPGRHTIRVENAGPQPHELALLKLAPGKKAADFVDWDEGGMKGPPPAHDEND